MFNHQFRRHLFVLFVNGPEFRVLYRDQAGIDATEPIDYISSVDGMAALLAFLRAFRKLDATQQGIDVTAVPLFPSSERPVTIPVVTYVRDTFRRSLEGRHVNDPHTSLGGPGTRGYVALEWETQRFVFLKDTWRSLGPNLRPEGDTLLELNMAGEQETRTSNNEPGHPGGHRLQHHRLVVKEVCLPLTESMCNQQLVSLMVDCVVAHQTAYQKCALLHGDVSLGNVLVNPRVKEVPIVDHPNGGSQDSERKYVVVWQGLLSDWELAKEVKADRASHSEQTASMNPRSTRTFLTYHLDQGRGTWQFRSWYSINHPDQPLSIPDELESFVHVLVYTAARLVAHNFRDITEFKYLYFDSYVPGCDVQFLCPAGKAFCITSAKLSNIGEDLLFGDEEHGFVHPLNDLVDELLALIRTRYIVLKWEEREAAK
ncbi:hypothetical protein C8T65DRAFT_696053 [Cerioporus squamosus]|nr:hypothetical protein C8T65DRAFT_696053 [Cerioporus squamosus]